jgi:hypothetical protein
LPVTVTAVPTWVAPPLGHVFVVEKKKVIVPVGLLPPAKVAVSEAEPPTVIVLRESEVVRVVAAFAHAGVVSGALWKFPWKRALEVPYCKSFE